jgi:hypothetical protein
MKLRDDVQEVIQLKNQNKLQGALKENKIAIQILNKLYKDKHQIVNRSKFICSDLKSELKIVYQYLKDDQQSMAIAQELQDVANKVYKLLLQTEVIFNEHLGHIKSQLLPEHGSPEINFIASQRKVNVIDDINKLGLWINQYSTYAKQLLDIMHNDNGKLIEMLNKKIEDIEKGKVA